MVLPGVYPIIDAAACAARGLAPADLAAACLRGGAGLLQVRVKGAGGRLFLDVVRAVRALADARGARVIVNDRADIAALAGAAGVHVGQEDLPAGAARAILGGEAIVGLSTHTPAQVDGAAREPIDYLAVGPVFDTSTKDTGYPPRGLDLVRRAAAGSRPVVAIGGITLDTAASVFEAGASSVAIIADLFTGGDAEARVRAYLALASRR